MKTSFKLGLIGYPVSHSLSPKIQTAALKACELDGDYSLFPIHPDDTQGLKDLLARLHSDEITGLNVTIPHKQHVIPLLDELTPTAQAIGAVNVIYLKNNKLVGDNTDGMGFLSDLKKFMAESPAPIRAERSASEVEAGDGAGVREKSALVLGAGGSARSVVYALVNNGWNATIAARRIEQAHSFVQSFPNYELPITLINDLQLSTVDLIVNTTPLGMTPKIDTSPLPENITLPKNVMIYDLVYNPRETKLVRDARAQGLHATTGLGMLIEQAALGFELWTGQIPAREVLWNAIDN